MTALDKDTPVLELENVTKTYGTDPPVLALRGVSFAINKGELVAILGPSGSGKSTLLHLMGTLDRVSSGSVRITGLDTAELDDRDLATLRANRIGFVFQQFFLAEHASLLENVADGLLYTGTRAGERREQAAEALTAVGLGDRLKSRPTHLSGGQRQRVAIARALVGEPAIVLADEPTGNLDTGTSEQIMALIGDLNTRGATIAVITHDREVAARFRRRITIRDGLIVSDEVTEHRVLAGGAC
jgi:putative ABC transport system ATP-binding protein